MTPDTAGGDHAPERTDRIVPGIGPVLRTPDHRFEGVSGFDHPAAAVDDLAGFEGLRLRYIDLPPPSGRARATALCLHGQRGWGYVFRKTVAPLLERDFRVVIPDLFGFGRSDKPARDAVYTFSFHRETILAFCRRLDLQNMTVIGHDWGAWFGATLPMALTDRMSGLVMVNGTLRKASVPLWRGFHVWRSLHNAERDPAVGGLIASQTRGLSADDIAAYDAPFPDADYKAGVRRFPNLVPTRVGQDGDAVSSEALAYLRTAWTGRTVIVAGAEDPVLGPHGLQPLAAQLPKAIFRPVKNAGPFALEAADLFIEPLLDEWMTDRPRATPNPGGISAPPENQSSIAP